MKHILMWPPHPFGSRPSAPLCLPLAWIMSEGRVQCSIASYLPPTPGQIRTPPPPPHQYEWPYPPFIPYLRQVACYYIYTAVNLRIYRPIGTGTHTHTFCICVHNRIPYSAIIWMYGPHQLIHYSKEK
jgi:hypothetical protein